MEFTTDIFSLDKPSYFRSKQKELVEQYSAARIFLRETDDWEHWFNLVEDDVP